MMTAPRDLATTGAFMMQGMRDLEKTPGVSYADLLDVWGGVCVEMVSGMTRYAPLLHTLYEAAIALDPKWCEPGVFDYVVSSWFGKWYAYQIWENHGHGLPADEVCRAKCAELVANFFGAGEIL